MRKLALIFDLDGTLIDSSEDLALAVNGMLDDFGYPPLSLDQVIDFIGDGTPKLAERSLRTVGAIHGPDDPAFSTYFDNLMGHYEANLANKTKVYPGVYEFLAAHADSPMGVVTNKPSQFTRPVLEAFGMLKYFSFVAGGDTYEQRKPDPYPIRMAMRALGAQPEDTVVTGDGDTDIKAGKAAGAITVAALYGNRSPEALEDLAPDYTLDSFLELNDIIEEILTARKEP